MTGVHIPRRSAFSSHRMLARLSAPRAAAFARLAAPRVALPAARSSVLQVRCNQQASAESHLFDEHDALRRRLLYRSKQRGWLEMDIMLGGWVRARAPCTRRASFSLTVSTCVAVAGAREPQRAE